VRGQVKLDAKQKERWDKYLIRKRGYPSGPRKRNCVSCNKPMISYSMVLCTHCWSHKVEAELRAKIWLDEKAIAEESEGETGAKALGNK
jgi:hypothetical protein